MTLELGSPNSITESVTLGRPGNLDTTFTNHLYAPLPLACESHDNRYQRQPIYEPTNPRRFTDPIYLTPPSPLLWMMTNVTSQATTPLIPVMIHTTYHSFIHSFSCKNNPWTVHLTLVHHVIFFLASLGLSIYLLYMHTYHTHLFFCSLFACRCMCFILAAFLAFWYLTEISLLLVAFG